MTDKTCTMTEIEDSEGKIRWRCSVCGALNHNTPRTLMSRRCPVCGRTITEWLEIERDD